MGNKLFKRRLGESHLDPHDPVLLLNDPGRTLEDFADDVNVEFFRYIVLREENVQNTRQVDMTRQWNPQVTLTRAVLDYDYRMFEIDESDRTYPGLRIFRRPRLVLPEKKIHFTFAEQVQIKFWNNNNNICPVCFDKFNHRDKSILSFAEDTAHTSSTGVCHEVFSENVSFISSDYMEEISPTDQMTCVHSCGHCYHHSCIVNCLKHKSTCPVCRCDMSERKLIALN